MPIILNPWSYSYIQRLAQEATYLAEQERLEPALDVRIVANYKQSKRLNIPFLGNYIPEGWERTDKEPVFVDTTGLARQGDQAMPGFELFRRIEQQLKEEVGTTIGYGVIEIGQTQALVASYRRKEAHDQEET